MVACSSAVRYREDGARVFGTPVIKVCVGSIRVFGVEAAKAGGTKSPASIDAIIAPAEGGDDPRDGLGVFVDVAAAAAAGGASRETGTTEIPR